MVEIALPRGPRSVGKGVHTSGDGGRFEGGEGFWDACCMLSDASCSCRGCAPGVSPASGELVTG